MVENKKILVVDDAESNVEIILNVLGEEYDIFIALDGETALEIAKEDKPDLILLDILMPVMDGYEVCRKLKSDDATKNIPVIFITAKVDDSSIEQAYEVGGVDYVSKPFRPRELLARVKSQLELKFLIHSLEEKVDAQVKEVMKAKELMFQSSRMAQMGEMISMIAHQWRQPLGAISAVTLGLITKVKIGAYDAKDEKAFLACQNKILDSTGKIDELVQGLSGTIDDFRNFFKADKNISIYLVDLPISKSLQIIEASLLADNIKIVQEFKSKNKIEMYDRELMQVILNILKNSQDNFKDKKIANACITIRTKDIESAVVIELTDNGGGIDENIISKIFDPYFSTKSEKTGTGLGLAMSKTIIDLHHCGAIDVSNTDDGVCFTITLRDQINKNSNT